VVFARTVEKGGSYLGFAVEDALKAVWNVERENATQ
jgi:hypothetical protein